MARIHARNVRRGTRVLLDGVELRRVVRWADADAGEVEVVIRDPSTGRLKVAESGDRFATEVRKGQVTIIPPGA